MIEDIASLLEFFSSSGCFHSFCMVHPHVPLDPGQPFLVRFFFVRVLLVQNHTSAKEYYSVASYSLPIKLSGCRWITALTWRAAHVFWSRPLPKSMPYSPRWARVIDDNSERSIYMHAAPTVIYHTASATERRTVMLWRKSWIRS